MSETGILTQLPNKDQERLRGYQELLDFYNGLQWPGRERYGEKRLTFNYAKIFIDKITSYLMSGVGFTVDASEDTAEGRARAEQAENAIYQIYEANNLEQLDLETEIDCAILGDACYKVTWEGEAESSKLKAEGTGGRVRVTAPDMRNIYAWWLGDDVSRIWRVASKYQLSEEEVEMLYEGRLLQAGTQGVPAIVSPAERALKRLAMRGTGKRRTIVEVWTQDTFDLFLDDALLESGPNPYGFIPFIIFPKTRSGKG